PTVHPKHSEHDTSKKHPQPTSKRPDEDKQHQTIAMSNQPRSQPPTNSRLSTVPSQKPRQLSHLQAQLAQLTANMADLESLMRMTAGQAQDIRGLGGYSGAIFMSASKVLGEETVKGGGGADDKSKEGK
ncbi:hypothetical protein EJ02DRAFT_323763, partial [Clathrospora elynae]